MVLRAVGALRFPLRATVAHLMKWRLNNRAAVVPSQIHKRNAEGRIGSDSYVLNLNASNRKGLWWPVRFQSRHLDARVALDPDAAVTDPVDNTLHGAARHPQLVSYFPPCLPRLPEAHDFQFNLAEFWGFH